MKSKDSVRKCKNAAHNKVCKNAADLLNAMRVPDADSDAVLQECRDIVEDLVQRFHEYSAYCNVLNTECP